MGVRSDCVDHAGEGGNVGNYLSLSLGVESTTKAVAFLDSYPG